jgi:two-component system alkaline phosphatase synthesis response regulator PhoP
MPRVLVIEDEELVGTMVRMNLESEGYEVAWKQNGTDGLQEATSRTYDLVLLDISMPGMDGLEVLRRLRKEAVGTPVLMLTARSDVDSKVKALDTGADDYLTKPFDVAELLARVKAQVRRSQADRQLPSDRTASFDRYEINFETREAVTNEGRIVLSEKEAGLMKLLLTVGQQTLTRSTILDEVWGMDVSPTERTVDNVILRLRRLFEPDPEHPRHIVTVRGLGYRWVA